LRYKQPQRILVYRIGQLGDTIVALPAMWAIRKHFPNAFLALMNDQHVNEGYIQALGALPKKGLFDGYISYNACREGALFGNLLKTIPEIRRGRFDTLIYLAPRRRTVSQIYRDLAFFRLGGIRRFVGWRGMKNPQVHHRLKPLPHLDYEADHLLSRLARSGIPVPPPGEGCMDLRLTAEEFKEAKNWLSGQKVLNQGHLLIGMGVGSKMPAKIWPKDRYGLLGSHIRAQFGGVPIIFGGPEDRELGDSLIREWKTGANAAGELNVRQAAAALSFCRLYVGNDTGTMHLAAAVGTQCVAIFSARYFPGCWYPYGSNHIVLRAEVACEGCMAEDCQEFDTVCLKSISAEDVVAACRQALDHPKFNPVEPRPKANPG
jgi:heptosyltransferase III